MAPAAKPSSETDSSESVLAMVLVTPGLSASLGGPLCRRGLIGSRPDPSPGGLVDRQGGSRGERDGEAKLIAAVHQLF
jgi:hypothetical protein